MKKILILLILIGFVSANSGYYPVAITTTNGLKSFSYCEFDKPCKYLGNKTSNEIINNKIIEAKNVKSAYLFSGLGIIGLLVTLVLIILLSVKIIQKRLL